MVKETIAENGGQHFGAVSTAAKRIGIGIEALRNRVAQAEIDSGPRNRGRPGG